LLQFAHRNRGKLQSQDDSGFLSEAVRPMSTADPIPAIACPNCRQPMQSQDLEQNYHGVVRVDLCFACAGIWFDRLGSVQLAPAAVITLFKEIYAHRDTAHQPVAKELLCPRCGDGLELGFDLSKSGKFSYFRCLRGDGRFTPFFQFLREKQFVRSLTEPELQKVRSQVQQIRCSECGAPIDLAQSSQCKYCHAPVSFLDPEAVEKAMQMWTDADKRRRLAPEAVENALRQSQPQHPQSPFASLGIHLLTGTNTTGAGLDLVAMGIHAIGRLFE
jgi:hypothetical protein